MPSTIVVSALTSIIAVVFRTTSLLTFLITMSLKIETERKIDSEPCVAAWDHALFVGTEDGFIKTFDPNLCPGASWSAHAVQPFALAAGNGRIYSASNDGGVKVWSAKGDKLAEWPASGADVGTIVVYDNYVCTGDEAGDVVIYEKDTEKARYNVLEEVKGLAFCPPFLFTVRDLDVTITEIKPDESKTLFVTHHTMEGRAPLVVAGNRLLVMARGGNNLQLLDSSVNTAFKKLHEIKVSDMIVTSIVVCGEYAWTGGWDGCVRRWKIADTKLEAAGDLTLGACITALVASSPNDVYAVVTGGRIVHVTAAL